ncbi:protein Gawky isoform X1 [Homalodisca vitripennis]|nr:protein Gawky isoform X1 [Homalodisca vitripennis]XP_046663318.1 protein Gawky isoform X1 [Homalodisca vitripennis]XP_046663319.1 protein Gawky isoform X1 [Homalodisca vitripennis]
MFPNESSSAELTSKTNAFVQNCEKVQPINPTTDQVPELRDTIDCRADHAMKTAPSTPSPTTSHNGCEPCALRRGLGEGGRAGSLPHPSLAPSLSVISSSNPPSDTIASGALQSPVKMEGCSSNVCSATPSCSDMYKARWGIDRMLRLCGGGETATATSGWNNNNSNNTSSTTYGQTGSSGSAPQPQWNNNNGNNSQQRPNNNSSPQQPQTSGNAGLKTTNNTGGSQAPPTSQAPTAPASQPPTSQPQTNGQAGASSGGGTWAQAAGKGLPPPAPTNPPTPTSNSTKQQLEQLNNMREALFSQDGWGAHVNQDSGWDIPSSPEPGQKDSNGTPLPPVWKPNINNGTELWETNLRNGGQPPPRVEKSTPWGSHTPASNIGGTWGVDDDIGDSSNMWNPQSQWPNGPNQPQQPMWTGAGGPKKETEWGGGGGGGAGNNWGDPRGAVGGAMDPRDLPRGADMRSSMVDQRDPMRSVMDQHRGMVGGDVMMRGDPRGISGRLNGGASEMWPQQAPHHLPPAKPWPGGPPPKDKPNGWEEPSPPQQRRNIPNYDDGTSLWGSQQQRAAMQAAAGQNKVSHWKDLPPAGMGRGIPPGMPQNRMAPNDMKANNPSWPHPVRNGSWEGPHEVGAGGPWPDDKVGVASWNDPTLLGGGPKYKMGWDGDVNPMNPTTWDHPPKQPQKPLTKDMVWASKPFRILSDMGFKKEDIETALRSSNMILEDALDILNFSTNWRNRHSDIEPPFDAPAFPSQRYNPQQLPFAPPGSSGNGPSSSSQSLNSMSPAIVQKMMTQQPPPQQAPSQPPTPFTQTTRTQQPNQPSAHQLRMLVQQIQMAVQAGYLNHQILNQPLAPQTLILLNQLLQHIKVLQGLLQQQQMLQIQNPLAKPNSNQAMLHNAVQITKTKQQITNLQNQIQAQQAIYVKQQHQMAPQGDFFKGNNVHDPLSALPSNFSDLAINKEPQQHSSAFQSQQSRLTQWKLPSLDKDGDIAGGEFSRAPGTTTKPSGGNSSPNLNPLLGQTDGTWSRSNSEGGWPDSGGVSDDSKEWPNTSQANSQAFTDLVPEFEPGKPWKGTQMKSIEDDPSITPGSVVRSPLSLATIKDTEIFSSGGKTSPTAGGPDMPIPPLSLSSSTWSFNPPASTASSSFTSPLGKLSGSKSTWGEAGPGNNELWGAPNKARGPPPGLSSNKAPTANGWGSLGGRWGPQPSPATWGANTTWLLLKNLTPQIDGSTLKTLCVQHGPLQNFHLYLNHGIALAKYSTRDEANKAQGALNNCVLSNTTIFAETLGDTEVQSLLAHLGQQGGGGGGWARGGGKGDTWGTGWPPAASGGTSLWGPDPPADPHRATPSSLNSFLPGDLLGPSDSM